MEQLAPAVSSNLSAAIKTEAKRLGFDLVGIAPAVTPTGIHDFLDWLERGYAGDMTYLERREQAYGHPRHVLDGAKSIVMLGMNYNTQPPNFEGASTAGREGASRPRAESANGEDAPPAVPGRVARYAQGSADYHDVIRDKLKQLAVFVRREAPGCQVRGIVDTAPLLERDFARAAGLGWFGKNTMLINKRLGSWFFLAAMLVDVELDYDTPHAASHCGTCTRCLDACPTRAFVEPYVLDARRCISYLTIEHRGPIAEELRPGMGDWLFGCDICQEVCPWNSKAPVTTEPAFQANPDLVAVDVAGILGLSEAEFERRFADTALSRTGRAGLIRNAAIAAANTHDKVAVAALAAALKDGDSIIRETAAWALERLAGCEQDPAVDTPGPPG